MALSKAYSPSEHESEIYQLWEESGAFKPSDDPKAEPFSIIMPPPNANGDLHVGHAMFVVEDILTRYHRMKGDATLWLPGTDHAGIETQVVFERELAKAAKSRSDFSRDEFYRLALEFTKSNQHNIIGELKSLGFSADWSRLKFTLDDDIIKTVYETFKKMHDDGLIYRANRIVNWCPHCHSGFSDLEIKHEQRVDPLYYIKYGPFVLATVRPETKFGDTAVAVHPKDERYQQYIGQEIEVEGLLGKFKLKVIGDDHVDPDFGTGVIKVTPAHDPNDWEIGRRHNLEVKQVIGTDGNLTELAGRYAGMPVAEARTQVAHDLEERGLMDHIEMDYKHSVAIHDRCGTVIEPLVTEQWWLKVEELKKPAIAAVKDGTITITPTRFKKQYLDWLEGLRDWNISRQNWFGIRIPIYYRTGDDQSKQPYLVALSEQEAKDYYGKDGYEPETATFDTWFSSGQWPYATMMATGDFDRFYPTDVMATARDLIYLWVSRMVMFSCYRTGVVPFRHVYFWGTVTDAHGKKMSKSKGNVVNPLELTSKYGTDALRLALTIGITPGTGGSLSDSKVEGYRNFCNKLWNVARFILDKVGNQPSPLSPVPSTLVDKWILSRLAETVKAVTTNIGKYNFSAAGQAVYALLWSDLADWYIEASKSETNPSILVYALETILKLLHPIAPFVTEAIWQEIPWQKHNLIIEPWPEPTTVYRTESEQFSQIQAVIDEIRSLRTDLGLRQPKLLTTDQAIAAQTTLIKQLAGVSEVEPVEQGRGLGLVTTNLGVWLDVDGDTIQRRLAKLKHERDVQRGRGERAQRQLDNPGFQAKASAEAKQTLTETKTEADNLTAKLDDQIKKITDQTT